MMKKMRAVAAAMSLMMVMAFVTPVVASHFDELGLPSEKAMTLMEKEVLNGYPDGTLGLENKIKRSEFATIAARSLKLFKNDRTIINIEDYFSDVSNKKWYSDSLATSIQEGLISGYPDGTFKPENDVTNQEVLTMMVRMVLSDEDVKDIDRKGGYPLNYINAAKEMGLLKDSKMKVFQEPATRGDSFNIAYNAIAAIEKAKLEEEEGKNEDAVVEKEEVLTGKFNKISNEAIKIGEREFEVTEDTLFFKNGRNQGSFKDFRRTDAHDAQIVVFGDKATSINILEYKNEGIVVLKGEDLEIKFEEGFNAKDIEGKDINVNFMNKGRIEKAYFSDMKEDDFVYINADERTVDVLIHRESRKGTLNITGKKMLNILGKVKRVEFESSFTAGFEKTEQIERFVQDIAPGDESEISLERLFDDKVFGNTGSIKNITVNTIKSGSEDLKMFKNATGIYDLKGNLRAVRVE